MAKPPASPPHSDLTGIHRDRVPTDDPAAAAPSQQAEREARTDAPGQPNATDAGEGRGKRQ